MTNDRTKVIIEAFFGLTGHVNHHAITPDHYAVNKNTLTILSIRVANQTVTLRKVDNAITEVLLTPTQGGRQKLSPQQISDLTLLGKKIEQFAYFPQHVEWIFFKNAFFITKLTQATIHLHAFTTDDKSVETSPLLGSGLPGSSGIASGPVRIVTSHHDIAKVESGDVVVAKHTDHTYNAALKKAKAIITEQGGRMSHTGIIARGIGIPAVVNMEHATSILKNGHIVQVNGSTGQVYFGGKKAHVIHHPPSAPDSTATKIFVSVPQASPTHDLLDIDGAELSGSRLIQEIGTHPKRAVEEGKSKEFSKLLADKIAEYCDVFSPRPVIYELSNLTTDEYRSLVGGRDFEPDEKNAHLGYRGILRHLSDPSLLQVELDALSLVRNGRNMKNVSLLIPHVRTLNELIALKEKLTRAGFYRNPSFKLWLRADTPATGLLLEKYIHVGIDGISIDTDSLTTLVLGADRKNNDIAHHYNELDEAVLLVIEQMIKKAREYSLPVLVSGSAVTLHTTLTEKLVEWGVYGVCITHLNHSPVKRHIAITEKKLIS